MLLFPLLLSFCIFTFHASLGAEINKPADSTITDNNLVGIKGVLVSGLSASRWSKVKSSIMNKEHQQKNEIKTLHSSKEDSKLVRVKRSFSNNTKKILQEIVNLIGQRLLLADKVAVAKWDNDLPVEDLPREEIILENVVKQAVGVGLESAWALIFFQDQMEANKDIQNELIENWRMDGERPDGLPPVDLVEEIRPQIDQINQELIILSKTTEAFRKSRYCLCEVEHNVLHTTFCYKMDALHQRALQRATSHLCI